ncbi:MAG: thioredoxin, partial [Methanoregula sp.]|nr:thioredoxin [Methanoregula sp.]
SLHPIINIPVDQLHLNDQIYAVETIDAKSGKTPDPAKIPKTISLSKDCMDSGNKKKLRPVKIVQPFICGRCIHISDIVNGAMVQVVVNEDEIFNGPVGFPSFTVSLGIALTKNDVITARQSFPDNESEKTAVRPVKYPEKNLPQPKIIPPLIECAPSFQVGELVTGAVLSIFERNREKPIAEKIVDNVVDSVEVKGGLQEGWILSASQSLCKPSDTSPRSDEIPVEEVGCFGIEIHHKPKLVSEFKLGINYLVIEGIHESKLSVLIDGKCIGTQTCFGHNLFKLEKPLASLDDVELVQSFECKNREWEAKAYVADVVEIKTRDELNKLIKTTKLTLMVDYYESRCSPCMYLAKELPQIASYFAHKAIIAKYCCDMENCGISAFPTSYFYQNGKNVSYVVGYDPQAIYNTLKYLTKQP